MGTEVESLENKSKEVGCMVSDGDQHCEFLNCEGLKKISESKLVGVM